VVTVPEKVKAGGLLLQATVWVAGFTAAVAVTPW